jgi:hypothetical protein
MSNSNSAKAGTQTFLIECNRGNSVIDANAPESNNGKWTTKTDFQFKRGDRVGVEAIMIESTGAGSQQQTIEFSGENIKNGDTLNNWTDDVIVLEFGFYVKNNAEKTINLPVEFKHNLNNDYGLSQRINEGTWIKPADVVAGTPAENAYKFQYPGIAPVGGIAAATYGNGGYNFKNAAAGSLATAYDIYEFLAPGGTVIPFGLAGTIQQINSIILSKTGDPNPNANILVDAAELTIPLPGAYNLTGQNTPFASGLGVAMKNVAGQINTFSNEAIELVRPQVIDVAGVPTYTGRLEIVLNNATDSIDIDTTANIQIIATKPYLPLPGGVGTQKMRWGTSSNPLPDLIPGVNLYEPGARLGIGLYNGSAPNGAIVGTKFLGLRDPYMRLNGGSAFWEQTRVWDKVDALEVPALGSSTLTTPAANGARNLKTRDLRNYKDNRPYILTSPEYQAPQPTPNGLGMCPKLEPMTAYVIIRADSSFEDVNNLAQKFTEAFHAINPLVLGQGKDLDKYLDNQEFPYNNTNNTIPLTSTGYYSKLNATNAAGALSADYNNSTAALYNRVEPLWIGNLVKCIPANLTTSPDWKNQPGNPYYYYPNDMTDYLKVGDKGDWNWNNLIYGNMGLVNFNKCWSGDRFIRVKCWDGNTTTHPHRDIPRPVVLNTQMRIKQVSQPAPPTTATPFSFIGSQMLTYEPIFTNIEYTDDNLDIIQECMRHSERYIVERRAYLDNTIIDDFAAQQASPYWEYEMDIGMSRGDVPMNQTDDVNGIMSKVITNWISEFPASANDVPNPAASNASTITPAQSYPGNGGEVEIQQARDIGRVQVFSRFQDDWLTGTGVNGSPKTTLENPAGNSLGDNYAMCVISNPLPSTIPLLATEMKKSQERNIGALPYIYNDENGVQHKLTFFMVSKVYDPETVKNFGEGTNGRSSWELGFFGWGEFFGFSPQFGYDQPAVIPVNPDNTANKITLEEAASSVSVPQPDLITPQPDLITPQPDLIVPQPDLITPQPDIYTPPVPAVPAVPAQVINRNNTSDGITTDLLNTYDVANNVSPIVLTNSYRGFADDGGLSANYTTSHSRHITFDAGAGNKIMINPRSFSYEHSTYAMYDRLGITCGNTISSLSTSSGNLSNADSPLSAYMYQSSSTSPSTIWGNSWGNGGNQGDGWIFPSNSGTDSKGNNNSGWVNTWYVIDARYIRFYFKSDGSSTRPGWDILVARQENIPAQPAIPEVPGYYTPQPDIITPQPDLVVPQPDLITPQPDIITPQPDLIVSNPDATLSPELKWRWNNQNYLWVGANDAAMVFDNTNNRFTLSQLYTEKLLSAVDAKTGTIAPNETQLGEVYAGMNTNYAGTGDSYLPTTTNVPKHYKTTNQGVEDAVCGVFLNNVYFAPKNWKPPTNINPKNIYSPGSNSYYFTEPHDNPQVEQPQYPISTYSNITNENRVAFLAPLTKATPDNWTGNLLDKMGFDYEQIIPPYGGQDNRYSAFTYGRTDIATMYEGTKPLMLNAETDVAADLDMNVFTYNAATNAASLSALDGTPLYTNGLLNNNPINLGNMVSAKLIANRIPTLFACPFYLVISDICPTQFQSGSMKQDCIFYGLKNYGAGQYFYVFGSNYSQLVDTDRTITQVNTEIRNPLTGRLARLSKNSCIIYKVERDISLPAIEVDIQGQPIAQATPQTQDQDEMTGVYNELKKLVNIQSGEKAELSTLVKEDTGTHDTLTSIKKLMKRLNIHGKNAVGITDNMDFGGAVARPDTDVRLTREEAERIVRDEIELEEAEGGNEMKQGDKEGKIRERADELMKSSIDRRRITPIGKGGYVDAYEIVKDLGVLLVDKALRALPITMGRAGSSIGNPAHIATAIRNSLAEFQPLLEKMAREIEAGELDINDAIRAVESKEIILSATGRILKGGRARKKGGLKGGIEGIYYGIPDLTEAITESWFSDRGANIEGLIKEGLDRNDFTILQGEDENYEPMSLDEIRKQREDAVAKMRDYKRKKYVEKRAGGMGATEDMLLEGRNLIEQEARQVAMRKVREEGKALDAEAGKELFDKFYKQSKREQEKEFQKDPLAYIREFGAAGQGIAAEKIMELQETHRRDEDEVRQVKSSGKEGKAEDAAKGDIPASF